MSKIFTSKFCDSSNFAEILIGHLVKLTSQNAGVLEMIVTNKKQNKNTDR